MSMRSPVQPYYSVVNPTHHAQEAYEYRSLLKQEQLKPLKIPFTHSPHSQCLWIQVWTHISWYQSKSWINKVHFDLHPCILNNHLTHSLHSSCKQALFPGFQHKKRVGSVRYSLSHAQNDQDTVHTLSVCPCVWLTEVECGTRLVTCHLHTCWTLYCGCMITTGCNWGAAAEASLF